MSSTRLHFSAAARSGPQTLHHYIIRLLISFKPRRRLASSSAAEPTFALLECADRAQEVDLAERGPVDVCEV